MTSIAVIDVETTGLHAKRQNRIVEVAALIIQSDGTQLREFTTLVNPERDIGPTHIHGINTSDILSAPRFIDIAGALLEVLDGCVALVGHNIRFDLSFLSHEYERLGYSFPICQTICTMALAGGRSLSCACSDYNIDLGGPHAAWQDAKATATLFTMFLNNTPALKSNILRWRPIIWPKVPYNSAKLVKRKEPREIEKRPHAKSRELIREKMTAKRVCFTGECQCKLKGEKITREMATRIASQRGLTVAESVTKSLDLLIAADPLTQSTKANKARKYDIRIMHEPMFWHALGLEVD
jgi:DNA polymerase III epsilon subunit family exonuclease